MEKGSLIWGWKSVNQVDDDHSKVSNSCPSEDSK